MTFDDNVDLLIPYQSSVHYVTFYAYIWDEPTKQFIKDSGFEDVWNPSVDSEEKRILACDFSNQMASYIMVSYIDNRFIITNTFGYRPAYFLSSEKLQNIPNANNLMNFDETKRDNDSGIHVTINDFYILSEDFETQSSERNDIPELIQYYESDSFWDMYNPKWRSPFYKELRH